MNSTKKWIPIVLFIMIFSLVACTSQPETSLKANDFSDVKMGMSVSELEAKLGKPHTEITNESKAQELFLKDSEMLTSLIEKEQEQLNSFIKEVEDMQHLGKSLSTQKGVKVLQYKYDNGKTKNIYVAGDKVLWMTFD